MVGTNTIRTVVLFALVAGAAGAVEYKRERYSLIVDRSPFGEDPSLAIEAGKLEKEQAIAAATAKKLGQQIRLCFLMRSESGEVKAGFQNIKAQKGEPKSVVLMVGESFRGMQLQNIDMDSSSATLNIAGKPVTFELTRAPTAAKAAPKKPTVPPRRFGGGFRSKPAAPKPQKPQLSPEEQAAERKRVQENLRQYQMEVIRAGMPPLPIPLTQEMDDQLVTEGVLPPPNAAPPQ